MSTEHKHFAILAAALLIGYLAGRHAKDADTGAANLQANTNIASPAEWWSYAGSWAGA